MAVSWQHHRFFYLSLIALQTTQELAPQTSAENSCQKGFVCFGGLWCSCLAFPVTVLFTQLVDKVVFVRGLGDVVDHCVYHSGEELDQSSMLMGKDGIFLGVINFKF